MRAMSPTRRHRRTDAIALGNPQGQFRDRKPRFRRLIAKSSMSFEPDRRKSRKSTFLHLQVSQTLSKTRVSRRLFSVVSPSITRRSNANAFTACSALLLFQPKLSHPTRGVGRPTPCTLQKRCGSFGIIGGATLQRHSELGALFASSNAG